jgi:hypothetical protein
MRNTVLDLNSEVEAYSAAKTHGYTTVEDMYPTSNDPVSNMIENSGKTWEQ